MVTIERVGGAGELQDVRRPPSLVSLLRACSSSYAALARRVRRREEVIRWPMNTAGRPGRRAQQVRRLVDSGRSGNRASTFSSSTVMDLDVVHVGDERSKPFVQEPSALLGLGSQGGHGDDGGIDGVVHRVTSGDIESGPMPYVHDDPHDRREEEELDDNNNKLMDKLSKFILMLVAGVSLPGAGSTAMRFNRAAAIFLLISFLTSSPCVVFSTHRRLPREWHRTLVCASCASFVLVASLFLASLDPLLFAAVIPTAVIVISVTAAAMEWSAERLGSAAVDDDDGDNGGQSADHLRLMVRIFDNCALFVTGGLAGLFFGSNYSKYLTKASGLGDVVRVLWIALFLDMAIGIFVMAGIAARIQAITAHARRFYYATVAPFGFSVVLFIIVMGFGQHTTMAPSSPPTI